MGKPTQPPLPPPMGYLFSKRGLWLWETEASPGRLLCRDGREDEREARMLAVTLAVLPGSATSRRSARTGWVRTLARRASGCNGERFSQRHPGALAPTSSPRWSQPPRTHHGARTLVGEQGGGQGPLGQEALGMGGVLLHLLLQVPDEEGAFRRRLPVRVGDGKVDQRELRLAVLGLLVDGRLGPALRQPLVGERKERRR